MVKSAKIVLKGGLGNQLFQLSRALSISNTFSQVRLVEDFEKHTIFRPVQIRNLVEMSKSLPNFGSLTIIEKLRLKWFRIFSSRARFLCRIVGCRSDEMDYDDYFFAKFYRVILFDGYWQSNCFVSLNEKEIFDSLSEYVDSLNTNRDKMIPSVDVLLHIRGGDYIQNRSNSDAFGILSPKYYSRILDKLKVTQVTAATDDLEWLAEFENSFVIDRILDPRDYDEWDLIACAMTSRIFVAANSSLSWWAGFLAAHKGARVIIPNPWFRRESDSASRKYSSFERAPSDWIE